MPGRTCAHDPARAAEGGELRSTSVEFSASWWVSVPCVVRDLRAQRDRMPWLAPAGLRGGMKLEVGATPEAASHIPSLCCPSTVLGFHSLASKALRRPSGLLLRQQQSHRISTLRHHCVSAVAAQTLGAPSREPCFSTGGQEAEGRQGRDGCVADDRRTPGRYILEASSRSSSPATLSSPLPPLATRVPYVVMDWAA